MNAVGSKLYHTVAYSRGEVAVLVGLIGTDKNTIWQLGLGPVDTDQYTVAVRDKTPLTICNTASTRFTGYHPMMR